MSPLLWAAVASAIPVEVLVRTRDDGDPVRGATVEVVGGAGPAEVDRRGRVTVELDGAGPWRIRIASEGRDALERTVDAPAPGRMRVWLSEAERPVEIVVEGLAFTSDVSRQVVDAEQARETPGTLDDAFRLVQALPGNVVQREYSPTSSDLAVRGSLPGDNRYYLDGIEVPYLYHFNQYASVFPASQIGQLELLSSTFSSRYGDAVGAVVEAQSRLERPEAVHGSASVNFVMLGGDVRVPIGEDWWVSASGRRSYQDLAGEQTTQFSVWPTFYDLVVRAERGDERDGTGLFVAAAGDGYTRAVGELDVLDPLEIEGTPDLAYDEGFTVAGVRRRIEGAKLSLRTVTGYVRHRRDGVVDRIGAERFVSDGLAHRTDLRLTPRPESTAAFSLEAGTEIRAGRTRLQVTETDLGVRVAEETPFLARGSAVDDGLDRLQVGVYGTANFGSARVRVMPGVRVEGDTGTGAVPVQPRVAVRARIGDATMVKAAGGRYTQTPRTAELLARPLPITDSWQVAAGIEQTIGGRLELGLEGYAKALWRPTLVLLDAPPRVFDTGNVLGAELTTRYRLRETVFFWGFVSVGRSRLANPGEVVASSSDQRVAAGIVGSAELGRWTLGLRYKVASGLPFTQVASSVYDATADRWLPVVGPPNGERLPTYHKVDVRVARRWTFRGWSLDASAELWYVPPAANQLYPIWNFDYSEQAWVAGPGLLPLAGLRASW